MSVMWSIAIMGSSSMICTMIRGRTRALSPLNPSLIFSIFLVFLIQRYFKRAENQKKKEFSFIFPRADYLQLLLKTIEFIQSSKSMTIRLSIFFVFCFYFPLL